MECKENIRPDNRAYSYKSEGVSKNRGFGKLLDSACKDHNDEVDSKLAFNVQCKDITNVINKLVDDFEREEQGLFIFTCMYDNINYL